VIIKIRSLAGIIIALACVCAAPAQAPHSKLRDEFVRYAAVQAVTGREAGFIQFLKGRLLAGVASEIDNMGNLIVRVGDAAPQLLVVTSVDERGFLVTDITEEGFLRVAAPGGRAPGASFTQFHEGHYVDISTRNGIIRGVVALPSSHLVRGRRESLTVDRMLIDIGARSREEAAARGVEILNPLAAVKDIAVLAENRVAGPMLSRKFGALALMEAVRGYSAKPGMGVVFAWATQSALSNSGVTRLARRFSPRQVLIVGAYQRTAGRTVRDPVEIFDSGVLVPDAESPGAGSELLKAAQAAAGAKIKLTPSPTAAVPEARAFGSTADTCAVAIPVLFPGSLVETIDLDDLQQLIEFIKVAASR